MENEMFLPGMNQEDVDTANRLEFERDLEGLELFYNEMDLDDYNGIYLSWMATFEALATPEARFPVDMDVDYSVVDFMFDEGLTPDQAVLVYWDRV